MKSLFWALIGIVIFILILVIPCCPELPNSGKVVMATTVLMAIWWISEALPMGVTAFLPIVIFPLFGVISVTKITLPYANHNIFLFLGGLIVAQAIQKWNLHKRIAVFIVNLIGTNPKMIILGFMIATAFLSMWISNTATTLMMLPIGMAILASFGENIEKSTSFINFSKTLMLGIAYSASIGGMATLVGTPPNLVFAGMYQKLFHHQITFSQWLEIGLPVSIFLLATTWLYLVFLGYPFKELPKDKIKSIILKEKESLGKMIYEEKILLIVFILLVFAWITRSDINFGAFKIPGWANLFEQGKYIKDSTVSMFFAIILFMIPSKKENGEMLLNWKDINNLPWEVLFLFGGGFALAEGFSKSGLTHWVGQELSFVTALSIFLIIIIIVSILDFLTEFTSNTATTTIMLPILAGIAVTAKIDPLLLMVPATLGASCAFMLPVATPPNAIVMGSGVLQIKDMVKAGIWLDIFAIIIVSFYLYFFIL